MIWYSTKISKYLWYNNICFTINNNKYISNFQTSVPGSYPQVVPEQLDTHQLQRLQQLKESNA